MWNKIAVDHVASPRFLFICIYSPTQHAILIRQPLLSPCAFLLLVPCILCGLLPSLVECLRSYPRRPRCALFVASLCVQIVLCFTCNIAVPSRLVKHHSELHLLRLTLTFCPPPTQLFAYLPDWPCIAWEPPSTEVAIQKSFAASFHFCAPCSVMCHG